MKLRKISQALGLCLLGGGLFLTQNALAASSVDQQLQQVLQEQQQLQKQVKTLTAEVVQLQRQKKVAQNRQRYTRHAKQTPVARPQTSEPSYAVVPPGTSRSSNKYQQELIKHLEAEHFLHGVTVTGSRLVGLRSAYDGSDLIVNLSTMNEDLRLLQQRQEIRKDLEKAGLPFPDVFHPLIELSGSIEAQGIYQHRYQGITTDDIDLTRAEFDVLTYISPWVLGLMSMSYDNSPLPANVIGAGQRVANSRVFLKRGFITIGNLNELPLYFTIGQKYAPFGRYNTQLLSLPSTLALGRTRERMVELGFFEDGLYASLYAFRGDANVASSGINNGGANLGIKKSFDKVGYDIGAGYIGNIADAEGLQNTGASLINAFQGFGYNNATELLQHRVSGTDLHAELDLDKFNFIGEYILANRSFDPIDMSFNNNGARPTALHAEGDYNFTFFDKPTTFTLAYENTSEALAANLPLNSYIAEVTISIWKDTIEGLEYRYDQNYPSSDVSSGQGFPIPVNSVGGSQNTITAQIGIYF